MIKENKLREAIKKEIRAILKENDEWDFEVEYMANSGDSKKPKKYKTSGTKRIKTNNIDSAKKKLLQSFETTAIKGTIKILLFEPTKNPGSTRG